MQVRRASKTHTGLVREHNEDSILCLNPPAQEGADSLWGYLAAVADGMGGYEAGDLASQTCLKTINDSFYSFDTSYSVLERLEAAVHQANEAVYAYTASGKYSEGIGTTIAAVALAKSNEGYWIANIAHVGDSRVYMLRGNTLQALTTDHSLVEEQRLRGEISEYEAETADYKNVITRALGHEPEIKVDLAQYPVQDGDVLMLCSDGLTNEVPEDEILQVLSQYSPTDAVNELVRRANQYGGRDNISCVVLSLRAAPAFKSSGGLSKFSNTKKALIVLGVVAILAVAIIVIPPGGTGGDEPSNHPPGKPDLLKPLYNEEVIEGKAVVLEWKCEDPDEDDELEYIVFFGDTETKNDARTECSYTIRSNELEAGKTYSWYVQATDPDDETTQSATSQFTYGEKTPPEPPQVEDIGNEKVNQPQTVPMLISPHDEKEIDSDNVEFTSQEDSQLSIPFLIVSQDRDQVNLNWGCNYRGTGKLQYKVYQYKAGEGEDKDMIHVEDEDKCSIDKENLEVGATYYFCVIVTDGNKTQYSHHEHIIVN